MYSHSLLETQQGYQGPKMEILQLLNSSIEEVSGAIEEVCDLSFLDVTGLCDMNSCIYGVLVRLALPK